MCDEFSQLMKRVDQGGKFTLDEIRDHFAAQVPHLRALELTVRVHQSVQDLSEAERVCALVCALMMELV
jgi:hypothetical protein